MYTYDCRVIRVVDADTIDGEVDLGFHLTAKLRFRLSGIDAWEVRGKERAQGLLAKQRVIELIEGHKITIKTGKTGKFGRWLAQITLPDGRDLAELLVKEGHAVWKEY